MRSPRPGLALWGALALCLPALAHADAPGCVTYDDPGLRARAAAALAALRIETRKAGAPWRWSPTRAADCPEGAPLMFLETPRHARLRGPGGTWSQVTADGPDESASRALARRVLDALAGTVPSEPAVLLVEDADPLLPPETPVVTRPTAPQAAGRWRAGAGADWIYQPGPDRHVVGAAGEVSLELVGDWLSAAVVGRYGAGTTRETDGVESTVDLAEVGAMVRAALVRGPWAATVGAGGGWQRRFVSAGSTAQRGTRSDTSDATVVSAELGGRRALGPHWALTAGLSPRGYASGRDHAWLDQTVYAAPTWSIGARVGLEARF